MPARLPFWSPTSVFRLLLSLALLLVGMKLAGCRVLMPPEIRSIVGRLEKKAADYSLQHPQHFHSYQSNGRTLHFVEAGAQGDEPLVIFIHGSPGDWKAWVEYLADAELTERAHLIAVDRPGFGGSGAGLAERSLAQQCRDLAPLLERASPGQRVVLVGHSFGGPVVCRLAMDHPAKVTDVIVLAGSIDPDQESTRWYQHLAEWGMINWLLPRELVTANREIMPLKGGLTEMLPRWSEMRQRVSVMQGEADGLVPPANADFAKRMLTGASSLKITRLPWVNHFLPW